jgi:hypothetical protein
VKYAFVRAHHPEFRVSRMCQVLQISRSGYYDWQGRGESPRSQRDQVLLKEIRKIHEQTKEATERLRPGRRYDRQALTVASTEWLDYGGWPR